MAKLKKIGILFSAKLVGLYGLGLGIIAGILYSFGGLLVDSLVTLGWISGVPFGTPGLSYGTVLAFGALFGMPLIFAAFGLVGGVFGAVFYNLATKWFAGLEVDFES